MSPHPTSIRATRRRGIASFRRSSQLVTFLIASDEIDRAPPLLRNAVAHWRSAIATRRLRL